MLIVLLSAVCSWFFLLVLIPQLSMQLLDQPNSRSSHCQPTPRGGGVAFVRWNSNDRSWSIDDNLTAGDVLTLPPVSDRMLVEINLEKHIQEGVKLADDLELTKLKLRKEKYLKNKKND